MQIIDVRNGKRGTVLVHTTGEAKEMKYIRWDCGFWEKFRFCRYYKKI